MGIYECIKKALSQGILIEPFNAKEVYTALGRLQGDCSYPSKTLQNFLPKHRKGHPSKTTELFERISTNPVKYKLL